LGAADIFGFGLILDVGLILLCGAIEDIGDGLTIGAALDIELWAKAAGAAAVRPIAAIAASVNFIRIYLLARILSHFRPSETST
jgi:hypothetical protein